MLGWILHFRIALKNAYFMFSIKSVKRTFFEKNLLKVSIVSESDLTISSFSDKFILSLEIDLSEIKIFTVF